MLLLILANVHYIAVFAGNSKRSKKSTVPKYNLHIDSRTTSEVPTLKYFSFPLSKISDLPWYGNSSKKQISASIKVYFCVLSCE